MFKKIITEKDISSEKLAEYKFQDYGNKTTIKITADEFINNGGDIEIGRKIFGYTGGDTFTFMGISDCVVLNGSRSLSVKGRHPNFDSVYQLSEVFVEIEYKKIYK